MLFKHGAPIADGIQGLNFFELWRMSINQKNLLMIKYKSL